MIKVKHLFAALALSGCVAPNGAIYGPEGKALIASDEEVEAIRKVLVRAHCPGVVPSSAEGGIIIDGTVLQTVREPSGATVVRLRVDDVIYGVYGKNEISLVTAPSAEGGAHFQVGSQYRVFTIKLESRYRAWRGVTLSFDGRKFPACE